MEKHLSTIFQNQINIVGSGRTDTGVHGRQQFFHVDLPDEIRKDQFRNKLNSFLPPDICVLDILQVKEDAHARFNAQRRSYEYWIIDDKDPFMVDLAYRFSHKLSLEDMNMAADYLLGKQDFESFSRVKTDVNNFICEIFKAQWVIDKGILKFHISSNRFLRGMVRAIVGTLLDIGQGKRSIEDLKLIIDSKDRKSAGRAVPAKGLYLTEVKYPRSIFVG